MWLLWEDKEGLLLGMLTVAWGAVQAHLQALLRLLVVVVFLLGARALGHPFRGTWGGFPLCCICLGPLAALHVLAEHLSSRKDLAQAAATSKIGLIVCTHDVI